MEKRHSLHLGVVAIEKGAFGSPVTKVTYFTFTYIRNVLIFRLQHIHIFDYKVSMLKSLVKDNN